MKNILLSTTGASPQVLTETLYSIYQSGRPFPNEVYVITTKSCFDSLANGLFRDGHLQALKDEYALPDFAFNESHIWLIEDENGKQIDDAKSVEDQTSMANFITRKVYEITEDSNTAIHASLAGGRKTMAFYFGYAMSMFGREQDTLSHVFVDDQYEFVRDFWYPTKQPKWVTGKHGQGEIDLSQAKVTLAEIPFVRMRTSIEPSLFSSMANQSFSQTVGMLNASNHQQLNITIDKSAKLISTLGVDIKFTAKEMAFYIWLFNKGEKGLLVDRYFDENIAHSISFLETYSSVATDPRIFNSFNTTPEDFNEKKYSDLTGMERQFLQPICSTINRKLREQLPSQVADKLEIRSISENTEQRYSVGLSNSDCQIQWVEKTKLTKTL
ncbi:CRISPR-associated protein [Photobacterium phosphoreum]|jgi:CRISPR-associated protein (TIGR02584 family)|uniref:CRISPR-associated ring nuclease Csm6 n=1 Tax=Photobacterium phosphoreum TaxID=659 RepID=UPI0007F963F8|nr:CRISPR-associated ring nuclease Csm6 [Photobacterium phosphoreum]OBU40156.1 CRISPR-associated protein [Photobacterium phosphoreum]